MLNHFYDKMNAFYLFSKEKITLQSSKVYNESMARPTPVNSIHKNQFLNSSLFLIPVQSGSNPWNYNYQMMKSDIPAGPQYNGYILPVSNACCPGPQGQE